MNRLIDFSSRFRILKGGKISLVVSALLGSSVILNAAPSGGVVTSGTANIVQNGTLTNINQSTQKASINWQSFSIASSETVNFNQPNVNSITLNRVVGNERSVIDGALNANGQVWILNSNGLLFGKNASINTAGLLATTAELSDTDFQNGNYEFKNSSTNSVINLGTIKVNNSSYVVLAGSEVQNGGDIEAVLGKVHLIGADSYSINLNGNSLVNLKVNKGVLDALVKNSGNILANGGEIFLTTNAVDELLKGVVNNTGIIEANSLDGITGKVELFAHGGKVQVGGTITALDGFVETSGKKFTIDKNTQIKAKTWLIDPTNLTVDDATAYETSLNGGSDVIIQTNNVTGSDEGNIYINDTIDWSTAQKLTLNAYKNIYINEAITATNSAGKVALYYGQGAVATGNTATYGFGLGSSGFAGKINLQGGNNFFTKLGSNGSETTWTVVTTANALMNISKIGNSVLGADVSASGIANWTPIGNDSTKFTGKFDGLGHTVDALTINNSSLQYTGLFGYTNGATIKNIGLTNVDLTATLNGAHVGGLVGRSTNSIVSNSYSTGSVTGVDGGGTWYYAQIGGLAGFIEGSIISNSYSTATVIGRDDVTVGGLVGLATDTSTISNSYATGSATGGVNAAVGGLVGGIQSSTTITNSYATGSVTGGSSSYNGGLVGYFYDNNTISNSYSTGSVAGGSNATKGGLIGLNDNGGTVTNSFYDKTKVTGMSDEATYGKTTQEMQTLSTFSDAGWSIELDSTKNRIYPYLTFDANNNPIWKIGKYAIALNYTLGTINTTYNGLNQLLTDFWLSSAIFGADGSSLVAGTDYKFVYDSSDATSFKNAGTYSDISVVILNEDYALDSGGTNTAGSFVVAQKALTVTGTTANDKTYDGTTTATPTTLGTLSGFVGTETVTASAVGTFDSKNAGDRTATFTYTLSDGENGGLASNYILADTTDDAVISKKDLGVTYTATNKTYDGTTNITVTDSPSSIISGDTVTISEIASMDNKNAGNGKTVNISSIALSGDDSSNYNLTNTTATTTVDVAQKALTITGTTAENKPYDGTTTATVNLGALEGFVGTETVTESAVGIFDSKNAGNRTATFTYTLADGENGGLASNYTLANTTDGATISKKDITVTANSNTLSYTGQTQSVSGFSASGLANGETVSVLDGVTTTGGSGIDVGEYTLIANGIDENYNLTFVDGSLKIIPKTITVQSDTTLDSIITPIVNNIIVPKVPTIVTQPTIQTVALVPKTQIVLASSNTNNPVKVMSSPVQNQATTMVVMSELKAEQKADAPNTTSDIRVPVGDNSIIELVNGGVNLPVGVDQLLFVINEKN